MIKFSGYILIDGLPPNFHYTSRMDGNIETRRNNIALISSLRYIQKKTDANMDII
jgi:hypothetical protein